MNIAKVTMDNRGRVHLPMSLLRSNDIDPLKTTVVVNLISGNSKAVKLTFVNKTGEDNE
tara:strand:+ start:678 stop:854 length:177 start_codon:yes stop_codon:yes gene_type:complete